MSALKISLPIDPPDRRLPEHSNRKLSSHLSPLPPSLPLELCRPGSVVPASLDSRIGGRDPVNIWLIVHCGPRFQLINNTGSPPGTELCWIAGPGKLAQYTFFFFFVQHASFTVFASRLLFTQMESPLGFDTKLPKCAPAAVTVVESSTLITTCVTLRSSNRTGLRHPADSWRGTMTTCFITVFALDGECVAGTVRGSVACLEKRSATVW